MIRVTKATVAAAVRKLDTTGLTVELDSETVTVWFDPCDDALRDKAQTCCDAVCALVGASVTSGNGSKLWVNYKRAPVDMGDFNQPSSRWHY